MSQEVIRLLFLDLLLEHLFISVSALLRFCTYSSLLGLFSLLLVVETNMYLVDDGTGCSWGNTTHQNLGVGMKLKMLKDYPTCWRQGAGRAIEWIDSSLASKLSSRVAAGYWTAEWIRTKQVRSSVTTQLQLSYGCYPALFDTVWLRVSFRLLLLLIGDVESIVGVPMLV